MTAQSIIIFTIVLCVAMLVGGCYSYSVLNTDGTEPSFPPDDKSVRITMKDGSVIESNAQHHVAVMAPSNFIYGDGTLVKGRKTNEQNSSVSYLGSNYLGRIESSQIDSTKTFIYSGKMYHNFWLKDSTLVRFAEGDFITVTPDQGTGLWCIGGKSDGLSDSAFVGKIDLSELQTIEVPRISPWKTIALGVLTGAAAGLLTAEVRFGTYHGSKDLDVIARITYTPIGAVVGLLVGIILSFAL